MGMKILLEIEVDVNEFPAEVIQRVVQRKLMHADYGGITMFLDREIKAVCDEGEIVGNTIVNYAGNLGHKEGRELKKKVQAHADSCEICTYRGARSYSNAQVNTRIAIAKAVRLVE